jgi:UDP-N-acetylmuramate: L-alanyl-gamma-D-glutamyl-meso-diaminopimelate ligase
VKSAFRHLVDGLPPGSLLVACDEDPQIPEVIAGAVLTVRRYGRREGSHWRLGSITVDPPWTTFEVLKAGSRFARFRTRLIGTHNLLNALSAIAVADHLGISAAALADGLETFEGVRRRQEIRGEKRGIVVMDDFAHHPTAVRETIAAVKEAFPERRLIAVFEPRTNSSMRKVFQPVYPASFECADMICIRQPPRLDKVPEAERFSSEELVRELKLRGKVAGFFADTDQIIGHLKQTAAPGDVILIMSNGGFDNIHERLLACL